LKSGKGIDHDRREIETKENDSSVQTIEIIATIIGRIDSKELNTQYRKEGRTPPV